MTYADDFNIRTTSVKFNDVADAVDGVITRQYATTTGTSSAYIANPTPAWQAYVTSAIIIITPHTTNAAGATIQLNGLAAKDMKIGGVAIPAGVLQTGVPTILAYTGTYFEVLLQSITVPVGQITAYAGSTAPTGWLMCDGSSQSTTGPYAALHGVIGYTYGGSGGSFNLPDLQRRAPVGKGSGDTLGGSDGVAYASRSMSHSHTVPDHVHAIGNHTHTVNSHSHTVNSHSHPLSDIGFAKIYINTAPSPDTLRAAQITVGSYASTINCDLGGNSGGGGAGNTTAVGLGGSTDAASTLTSSESPSTGNPNAGANTGSVTTPLSSGSATQPYLFVNYIIKF